MQCPSTKVSLLLKKKLNYNSQGPVDGLVETQPVSPGTA